MDKILNLKPVEMAGFAFECSCGKRHSVDINKIVLGSNIGDEITKTASEFASGQIFVLTDNHTFDIYGKKVIMFLREKSMEVKSFMLQSEHAVVPDEKALGRVLVEIESNTSLILAVGSGSINDLARYLSCRLHIPYAIVCTAPSMDGYASVVSPLIIEGYKKTYEAVYPYAIFADMEVIKEAPIEMIRAGFGDILGKFTALADWRLSRNINGEYYCETSVKLIENAIQKCIDNVDGIVKREIIALGYLMEALILSGVAMGLVGNSRPASGAEHHLAHYWEMDALAQGKEHPLHGNSVGAATVVIASIYEWMEEKGMMNMDVPQVERSKELLCRSGAADTPGKLGISRELFNESLLKAMEIRPRYTILRWASENGVLHQVAEVLTERFYSKLR